MKNIKFYLFLIASIGVVFTSCRDENLPQFVAHENTDSVIFVNNFASRYLLSQQTRPNIAERLIWTRPNFGVQANILYEVEGAIDEGFTNPTTIGATSQTNFGILVDDLLDFAADLGLDDDPNTTDSLGLPNNSGVVYVRVKAYLGAVQPTYTTFSAVQPLAISIIEKTLSTTCDTLYAAGAALVDHGWNFPGAKLVCNDDVQVAKVKMAPGHFRFFTTVNNWSSSQGYNYYASKGYTIDNNLQDANDTDDNFDFIGTAGIYTLIIDNKNKTITLTASTNLWAVGDAVPGGWNFNASTTELIESTPDVWSATITLNAGIFRFFPKYNDWNTSFNYPYYDNLGFGIDPAFEAQIGSDENFTFIGTPGTYVLTINAISKSITLN